MITTKVLKSGEIVDCEAIGRMEQTKNGLTDNNVLARLIDERPNVTTVAQMTLIEFVENVFNGIPGRTIRAGKLLDAGVAETEIDRCRVPIVVREEPITSLPQHSDIPITFASGRVLDISGQERGMFTLCERTTTPFVKDYDAFETLSHWGAVRFDISNWGLIAAYLGPERVGGAGIAFDTPASIFSKAATISRCYGIFASGRLFVIRA